MKIKKDAMIEKLKQKIKAWDEAFDQFQVGSYPNRLLAQVQYRKQLNALISTRLLVEERLLNFHQRIKSPVS